MAKLVCNMCGRELDFYDEQADYSIHTRIGYGSKYDGHDLNVTLCCDCMDIIIDECSVSPLSEKNYHYTE